MLHFISTCQVRDKAIGHTLVISTEHKRELLELQCHLIELILHLSLLVKHCRKSLGNTSSCNLLHRLDSTEEITLNSSHAYLRLIQEKVTLVRQSVEDSLACIDRH